MENAVYDLCIVGAGMFGSAAARHASAMVGVKVCLVGPDEPTPEERQEREIFAAYYDEGRITRTLDNDITYQTLAKHSISRYREIEKLSGIKFYYPVGFLWIGKKHSEIMEQVYQMASLTKLPVVDLCKDVFSRRYPFMKVDDDDQILLDDFGGGHISPRNLVAAQKKIARCQGCDIFHKVVNEVKPLINGIHEIICEDNTILKSRRVLFCTGAYTNLKTFPLPQLSIVNGETTVVLVKISTKEATRLGSMPSTVCKLPEGKTGVYILPPIKYPDGNYYLKIGGYTGAPESVVRANTLEGIRQVYLSKADSSTIEKLSTQLQRFLPGLIFEDVSSVTCVTSYSPSGQPYIDRITPTITVAVAGNGKGAKLSDEIGRIGAMLSITGRWDSELPKSRFEAIFQEGNQ